MAKTAIAAALAWELAALFGNPVPILAPLAAIITVQVTVVKTLHGGRQMLIGVAGGLGFAFLLSRYLGLHGWSIALVILLALLISHSLRMSDHGTDIAVGALLVMSLGSAFGVARLADSLIGAAVGIAVSLLLPSTVGVRSTTQMLGELGEGTSELLSDMGTGLLGNWRDQSRRWLQRARELDAQVGEASDSLAEAEESLQLNLRHRLSPVSLVQLKETLRAMEHMADEVRAIARTLLDLSGELAASPETSQAKVPAEFAQLLTQVGLAVASFSHQAIGPQGQGADARVRPMRAVLQESARAREAAARAMRVNPADDPAAWRANGALLDHVTRLLHEMDPEGGPHVLAYRREMLEAANE
jgi:uncharacterized membrane protein YgaE (UPF0421/DUF939 family)